MDVATRGVSAIVEYDYTAKEPDELDLVKGAIINNIKQMPGGWWEGTKQSNGKSGMFPDNFVRIIDAHSDDSAVTLREKSAASNRRCKVIYSYTQVNDDELSLGVGDVIEFLGEVEEGWWRGRLKTKIGVFPSNFVVAIEPSPILASKRPPSSTIATGTAATTTASGSSGTSIAAKPAAVNNTTSAAAAAAAAAAFAASLSTKKTNRLSFHSSKENLLSSTTSTTAAVDDGAPSLPPKPQRDYCRVEFPYAPQNEDELELKVGDIITVISMELPDKGWWKGESRGKVGVFPDNFVKLVPASDVSPLNDSHQSSHRTAKNSNAGHSLTAAATNSNSSHAHVATAAASSTSNNTSAASSKVFIKKSGSSSSTQSSNRKDSFGSRDSLNDILSETGLPSGNVAAQRKSLENKNLDLSNPPDASSRLVLKKQQLQQQQETKTLSSSSGITTNATTTGMSSNTSAIELRKSLENMDDKTKTPPPVLTKKPSVPSKKTTTVTSVAGNIFSGLKQKVKSVENKLTTTVSQDSADGVGSSKMAPGGLPDTAVGGNVVMRRAATIAVEDSDFDKVERGSILPDVRAGRVKAPKRRPPSAAINAIGESNNNNSIYLNGSGGGSSELLQSEDGGSKPQSSDDNSTGEEQLAKPKPREWEKIRAPWMEELKASQVKKKTSPSVEPRGVGVGDAKISSSSSSSNNHTSSAATTTSVISSTSSSSNTSSATTKVQSSSISSSSIMQQSMLVESSQQLLRKELNSMSSTTADVSMSKSMSGKLPNDDDVRARPNSLSIRNRSISPSLSSSSNSAARTAIKTSAPPAVTSVAVETASSSAALLSNATTTNSTAAKSTVLNNHHENNIPTAALGKSAVATTDGVRVGELEKRIEKLESVVHAQQRTIDELVRTLREETDRVKLLRGELDKYAQCVTQV